MASGRSITESMSHRPGPAPGSGGRPLIEASPVSEVLSVHMTQELADKVYRLAFDLNQSVTAIIRLALRRLFSTESDPEISSKSSRIRIHRYKGGPPPLRLRMIQHKHEGRARRDGRIWDFVDLREVHSRHQGRCGICGYAVPLEEFSVDHILPTSKNGAHVLENLQPAHRACNSAKGNR